MNLYTKYRSRDFSQVVGQKHVVSVLSSALILDRVSHAYLFSGPRGTGKTTLARLLAKSLNCENRKKDQYEPCNKCDSCKEINGGMSLDIIEIDAASNRGIDEIRALRDKVRFAPSKGKYKVFIIDEVHMLTREAFNALLKTLEEPPKHAIFILATTELHKVPETIVSRTQQFDFRLHKYTDIFERLKFISKHEKISIDDESLRIITNAARGGLRDAISLLDQVSSVSKKIQEKTTRDILGLVSQDSIFLFLENLGEKKTIELIKMCENLYQDGNDFYEFTGEVIEHLRRILFYKSGYVRVMDDYTDQEKDKIYRIAKKYSLKDLIKYIEFLVKVQSDIKNSNISYLPLEIAIYNLTYSVDETTKSSESNKEKEKKEEVKKSDVQEKKYDVQEDKVVLKKETIVKKKLQDDTKEKFEEINIDIEKIKKDWQDIVKKIANNHSLKIMLKNSVPLKIEDNKLVIGVEFKLYKDKLENQKVYQNVCECIEKYTSNKCQLKFVVESSLVRKIDTSKASSSSKTGEEMVSDAMDVFN